MDYLALTTYTFVMCITPGPNNLMVTASGANFGYRATVPHLMGILAGSAVQFGIACLGAGIILLKFPALHTALLWGGLAYMLYLAWKLLGIGVAAGKQVHAPVTFTQATLFQMVNPKAWIADITAVSLFLPKEGDVLKPIIIILVIATILTYLSTSFWTLFGTAMRRFLQTNRNRFIFNGIMAILLVVTAVLIIMNG